MGEKLLVSPSPHVRAKGKTSLIMLMVIVALLPSCVYGVLNFGMHALLILVLSTGSAVAAELVYELVMRKKITVTDGSAAVTGLLIGMNMPPMIAWWIPVIGSVFAIVVVKQLFGGLGRNFMNPALAARCFLVLAFSAQMTAFTTGTGVLSQVTEPTVMAEAAAEADAGANENAGTDADSTATAWTEAQTEAAEKTDADSAATAETEEKGKAAAVAKTDADSAATAETEETADAASGATAETEAAAPETEAQDSGRLDAVSTATPLKYLKKGQSRRNLRAASADRRHLPDAPWRDRLENSGLLHWKLRRACPDHRSGERV